MNTCNCRLASRRSFAEAIVPDPLASGSLAAEAAPRAGSHLAAIGATGSESPATWQEVLRQAVRDVGDLCRRLRLPVESASAEAAARFPLLLPEPLLRRIQPGDPTDPILRQVLPTAAELEAADGFCEDPLAEAKVPGGAGRLDRYQGRSLIIATGRCGVHCRYCFRRHRMGGDSPDADGASAQSGAPPSPHATAPPSRPRADEVILSGGDPLTLDDGQLAALAERIEATDRPRRLRVHTRMPVVIPDRVTGALVRLLRDARPTTIVVLQINHAAELDASVEEAIGRLVDAGIPVLSQSVLLRGVNDRLDALAELMEALVDLRVMPYYLHQLDRVAGAAHFEVPTAEGRRLMARMRERLPGYAVPRYVRQLPDTPAKQPLDTPATQLPDDVHEAGAR